MNAVVGQGPGTDHLEPLRRDLTQMIETYSLNRVLEQLGACCELRSVYTEGVLGHQLKEIGLDLLTLSERAISL